MCIVNQLWEDQLTGSDIRCGQSEESVVLLLHPPPAPPPHPVRFTLSRCALCTLTPPMTFDPRGGGWEGLPAGMWVRVDVLKAPDWFLLQNFVRIQTQPSAWFPTIDTYIEFFSLMACTCTCVYLSMVCQVFFFFFRTTRWSSLRPGADPGFFFSSFGPGGRAPVWFLVFYSRVLQSLSGGTTAPSPEEAPGSGEPSGRRGVRVLCMFLRPSLM